jgi:HEAT repeat protein
VSEQIRALQDQDPAVRYWAAVGLRAAGEAAVSARVALAEALEDSSLSVRIEAAAALAALGEEARALRVLEHELEGDSVDGILHASRVVELLGDQAMPARKTVERALARATTQEKQNEHPAWMFVRFALSAWLENR